MGKGHPRDILSRSGLSRETAMRDSPAKIFHIDSRDSGTVPGLTVILVPRCRDLLSRGILVTGLSRRFLSRSRLSRGFESRSRSWGFVGRPGLPTLSWDNRPSLDKTGLEIFAPGLCHRFRFKSQLSRNFLSSFHIKSGKRLCFEHRE